VLTKGPPNRKEEVGKRGNGATQVEKSWERGKWDECGTQCGEDEERVAGGECVETTYFGGKKISR